MASQLDFVIPVYNEGPAIRRVLDALAGHVHAVFRVLIAYDREDDETLAVIRQMRLPFAISSVRNEGRGVHSAITSALPETTAPYVLVWPADDDYNAGRVDAMLALARSGCEIVCGSRFMPGGRMVGAPLVKATIVRASAAILYRLARLPTHDPSNGLRLFSRRLIRTIPLESTEGFTYSIELLVKCHRLRWRIGEVPFEWHERRAGGSRFQLLRWLPAYFVWFRYAFATTYLRRGPASVRVRGANEPLGA